MFAITADTTTITRNQCLRYSLVQCFFSLGLKATYTGTVGFRGLESHIPFNQIYTGCKEMLSQAFHRGIESPCGGSEVVESELIHTRRVLGGTVSRLSGVFKR